MQARHIKWIAVGLFSLALVVRIIPGPRTIDDAYITFRYARNLIAGDGFVFNPGQRVLGTTTPLFTLLMAGMGFFTGGAQAPFQHLALAVNAIADGLSAALLLLIGRKLGASWAGAGSALAWAIAPFSVTFAIGGLETSLYVLLLLATCWAYLEKRYPMAATMAALSLLTRPDALLLVLPMVIDRLLFARKRGESSPTTREVLSFALPLLAWGIFAWLYFGSPLPQSVIAKAAAYRLPQFSALARLLQHYATPFLEHLTFGLGWIKIGLLLYPFFALLGGRKVIQHERSAWPMAAFPWVYFAVFSLANPLIFRWYLTPPLPFYFLFILVGLEGLLRDLFNWAQKLSITPQWSFTAFAFLLIIFAPFSLQLRGWTLTPSHGPQRPAPAMAFIELELLYKEAAERLQTDASNASSPSIAAGDVGVLGYYTDTKILDLVGLNSPEILGFYPLEESLYGEFIYAIAPDLVMAERPQYVVILEIYGRAGLLKDERFLASYELLDKLTTDIYGSDGLLIFRVNK